MTKDYTQFNRRDDNRPLDLKRHKSLEASMAEYGFIPDFHIICTRDAKGKLWVVDGQHRLAFATKLGLPVYWTETADDFDIAKVNNTQKTWLPIDYAQRFADAGQGGYAEVIEFRDEFGIPVTLAASLLAGQTTFSNVSEAFYAGTFEVTDRPWAKTVVGVYTPITKLEPKLKAKVFLMACMAVARVKGFSTNRMIKNAEQCRHKIAPYATREAYLEMLEEIYNFRQKSIIALKIESQKVMRSRNPTTRGKGEAEAA